MELLFIIEDNPPKHHGIFTIRIQSMNKVKVLKHRSNQRKVSSIMVLELHVKYW